MRGGRAARGERCAANSALVVVALHETPTAVGGAGVKGRFVQRRWRRAEFAAHGSPLQRCEGEARGHQWQRVRRKVWRTRSVGDHVGLTDLTLSCAAGSACRSRSGAAVAAHDVRRTEWRFATAVTPWRWRQGRQLGCRADAGPHQLHTNVGWRLDRHGRLRQHSWIRFKAAKHSA